jgi:hypothetical protein
MQEFDQLDAADDSLPEDLDEALNTMVTTYLLAGKLMLEQLQNHVLYGFRSVASLIELSRRNMTLIHGILPSEDGFLTLLRQHVAEQIILAGGWKLWKEKSQLYREYAVNDTGLRAFIAEALLDYPTGKSPNKIGHACDLHTNVDTPECDRSTKRAGG